MHIHLMQNIFAYSALLYYIDNMKHEFLFTNISINVSRFYIFNVDVYVQHLKFVEISVVELRNVNKLSNDVRH